MFDAGFVLAPSRPLTAPEALTDQLSAAWERIGHRAWELARWVVDDDEKATQAVVQAFSHRELQRGHWQNDALLLREVRREAVRLAAPPSDVTELPPGASQSEDPCSEVLALALVARLSVGAIADALETTTPDVNALLRQGLQRLRA